VPEHAGPIARGEVIGPYVVLDVLAEGGMGVVYTAYHPGLNRKAALKLIRPDLYAGATATAGRTRLLREAQAMAQLSHPNVVTVFDAGEVGEKVFIAMELVEGRTLKEWLQDRQRPWREIVAMFGEAGQGLAAAHRAGLIHRDFKPENVLVGQDGRPRVTDFGLARAVDAGPEPVSTTVLESPTPILQTPMTIAGSVMGTPGYLPLEQGRGQQVDARTDQFSFFASLHYGLYGQLPFAGATLAETLESMEKGQVRAAPEGTRVPSRIRNVLLRGLAIKPEDRFPSLDAGLEALQRAAVPPYRRGWPAWAALALVGAVAGVWAIARQQRPHCSGFESELAPVWGPEHKAALQQAMQQTGVLYAADAWSAFQRTVDVYARDWIQARTQACQALERDKGKLALATQACLEDRREELGAAATGLRDRLKRGDKDAARTAAQVAASLTPLSRCTDPRAFAAAAVSAPANTEKSAAMRKELVRIKTLLDARQHPPAEEAALALASAARAAGDRPLLAEVLFQLGEVQRRRTEWKPAMQTLEEADLVSEAIGFDWLRTRIAATLASTCNLSQDNVCARAWIRRGRARVERIGGDSWSEIRISTVDGAVLFVEGKRDEMVASMQHGLEVARSTYGEDNPQTVSMLVSLATAFYNFERNEDCLRTANEAMEVSRRVLGPNHPDVAESEKLAAAARIRMGEFEEGQKMMEHARGPIAATWGEEDFRAGEIESTLGESGRGMGDLDAALGHARRAEQIFTRKFGPQSDPVVEVVARQAEYLREQGKPKEAWAVLRRALAMGGKRKDLAVETAVPKGRLELDAKKYGDAAATFQVGLSTLGGGAATDTQDAADLRTGLGEAYLGLRGPTEAVEVLEKAMAFRASRKLPRVDTAETKFALAQALWESERDRPRAAKLATEAHQDLTGAPAWAKPLAAQVDAWLATHPQ
jgi:tetratricopeptide (TPR) repeat protein